MDYAFLSGSTAEGALRALRAALGLQVLCTEARLGPSMGELRLPDSINLPGRSHAGLQSPEAIPQEPRETGLPKFCPQDWAEGQLFTPEEPRRKGKDKSVDSQGNRTPSCITVTAD